MSRCQNHRLWCGRCKNESTTTFYRYGHTNLDGTSRGRYGEEITKVCDIHLMGDGRDGRPDFGWTTVRRISPARQKRIYSQLNKIIKCF